MKRVATRLASGALASTLAACAVLFDFDRYDTAVTEIPDDVGDAGTLEDAAPAVRGAACTADQSFGTNGLTELTEARELTERLVLTARESSIAVGAFGDERAAIIRIGPSGAPIWRSELGSLSGLAIGSDGDVLVSAGAELRHLFSDGSLDPSFGGPGVPGVVIRPSSLVLLDLTRDRAEAVGGTDTDEWELARITPGLPPPVYAHVPLARGDAAYVTSTEFSERRGVLACGYVVQATTTRAALARWLPSLDVATDFGVAGRIFLGPDTRIVACAQDDRGVVALGGLGNALALFTLSPKGDLRASGIGDAGVSPLATADPLFDRGAIAIDARGVIVFVSGREGPALIRFTRDLQIDPSFAAAGTCRLAPLGLGAAIAALRVADDKMVVLAHDGVTGKTLLGRVWL